MFNGLNVSVKESSLRFAWRQRTLEFEDEREPPYQTLRVPAAIYS